MLGQITGVLTEFTDVLYHERSKGILISIQLVVALTIYVLLRPAFKRGRQELSAEEKERRLKQWQPEPLVTPVDLDHPALRPHIVSGRVGRRVNVDGTDCLNLASQNFLGLLDERDAEEAAIACIHKYGVGSCGPRGFYGTNDVHLRLEERLAQFMHCEEAAVYAYGFPAIASAIPSYCKKGDLVFVDENVNFAIQRGLQHSRSTVVYFKHNDTNDLERILIAQAQLDQKNPKKAARQRRFLIAEAVYQHTGELCPLVQLVQLRKEHKLRFILDESLSFGTLGKTGRGLTELLNVNLENVDLIVGTLETAVASIGGFCVGTTYIVDHQRLSGSAYCFSASAPPFLAQAAISALDRLEKSPEIVLELNEIAAKVHSKFDKFTNLTQSGHKLSPIKHLYLKSPNNERTAEQNTIRQIVKQCLNAGLAVANAEYLDDKETHCPRPSLRVAVNRLLTQQDIEFAFDTLERISLAV